MDNFADERDFKILEADKYTFFVLARIMKRDCELLLTDHNRMIICYSQSPFPMWIGLAMMQLPKKWKTLIRFPTSTDFWMEITA